MKFPTKGFLNDTAFIEILKDAAQSGLTGIVRLENPPVIKVIYFHQGTISFASSNDKEDRLTEVLKRAGKLTPEQVEDAQARLKPNVSLGKTLVALGYVSAKDLLWGARSQVDGILHHLLFWNQGKYQVQEGALPQEIIHLNLPVTSVIFEGIIKTKDREWILKHIGSPDAVYAVSAGFQEQNQALKLPVSDLVSRLNGKSSLHEIAETSDMDTFEICKTVVALEYLNLARPVMEEPLQMTFPALEDLEPMEVPATPVEPVPPAKDEQELGQMLHLPTVDELDKAADQEAEPPGATEETPEPEPVTIEAAAATVQSAQNTSEPQPEPEHSSELDAVFQPLLEEPALDRVPMQSMVRGSQATPRSAFRWKRVITILLVVMAIGAGAVYYVLKKEQRAKPFRPTVVLKDQPSQLTPPTPEANPAFHEIPPEGPLRLLRNGRVADAAKSWNDTLTKESFGYTIQLVIACQAKTVADTHRLLNYSNEVMVLPVNYKGQVCHRVLYGKYPSKSQAKEAIDYLPNIFVEQNSPASVVEISKVIY